MKATESFKTVQAAMLEVGHVVVSVPRYDTVFRRYLSVIEALHEWKTACQRFDEDFAVWSECHRALEPIETSDDQQLIEIIRKHKEVSPKLRLDIRCIYVFAKIAFITYAGLLFAMADEKSQDWKSLTRFKNRIARDNSPEVLQTFNNEFGDHIAWFEAQVNLYRNDFIEHPWNPTVSNLIGDSSTVRISEIMGEALSRKDAELLKTIASELLDKFPELNAVHLDLQLYQWVCRNLEHVPKDHRANMENVIRKIGLESGDVEQIASKANSIFADFIRFFSKWYRQGGYKRARIATHGIVKD
jgi:hypothetical protein